MPIRIGFVGSRDCCRIGCPFGTILPNSGFEMELQ